MEDREINSVDILIFLKKHFRLFFASISSALLLSYAAADSFLKIKQDDRYVSTEIVLTWVEAYSKIAKLNSLGFEGQMDSTTYGTFSMQVLRNHSMHLANVQ